MNRGGEGSRSGEVAPEYPAGCASCCSCAGPACCCCGVAAADGGVWNRGLGSGRGAGGAGGDLGRCVFDGEAP
jgi:hypothetical protein